MDIEAQLKPLTQAGRLGFLIKARLNGTITKEEYDFYIHVDFGDTDTPSLEETGGVRTPVRQPSVEERGLGEGTMDGGNTHELVSQESCVTALERDDTLVFRERADAELPGLPGQSARESDMDEKVKDIAALVAAG